VTITRPGRTDPIVIRSKGGYGMMPCGTVQKGDRVEVRADAPGASVTAGNPGFCY
jgi:hypothetical protein